LWSSIVYWVTGLDPNAGRLRLDLLSSAHIVASSCFLYHFCITYPALMLQKKFEAMLWPMLCVKSMIIISSSGARNHVPVEIAGSSGFWPSCLPCTPWLLVSSGCWARLADPWSSPIPWGPSLCCSSSSWYVRVQCEHLVLMNLKQPSYFDARILTFTEDFQWPLKFLVIASICTSK
jgi:hypothetical protein